MEISGRWLLAAGAIVLAAAGCGSGLQAVSRHDAHDGVRPATASSRVHHVRGPSITKADAERLALILAREMGPRPRIVAARLMSPAAANWATRQHAPGMFSLAHAQTWLVWVRGTWRSFSCIVANQCGVRPHQLFFIGVNARTGAYDGTGDSENYPRGAL